MESCDHCSHLKSKWEESLKKNGFEDAEQNKLLRKWTGTSTSLDILSNKEDQEPLSSIKSNWPETHFSIEEKLLNDPEFDVICEALCKHGNHTLIAAQMISIWEMHCEGLSERKIAHVLIINDSAVHRTIKKLKELSKLWK